MHWLFYVGISASTHDASAMCLDPNLFFSGSRLKRSGGGCLSPSYTSNWLFNKSHHLAILSNST
jgi:hypothetical protein